MLIFLTSEFNSLLLYYYYLLLYIEETNYWVTYLHMANVKGRADLLHTCQEPCSLCVCVLLNSLSVCLFGASISTLLNLCSNKQNFLVKLHVGKITAK